MKFLFQKDKKSQASSSNSTKTCKKLVDEEFPQPQHQPSTDGNANPHRQRSSELQLELQHEGQHEANAPPEKKMSDFGEPNVRDKSYERLFSLDTLPSAAKDNDVLFGLSPLRTKSSRTQSPETINVCCYMNVLR